MKKILVIRFSAMGDVVMTTPVLYSLVQQFTDVEITLLSRPQFESFFIDENINFVGVDFKKHKGIWGLFKIFRKLRKQKFDAVADLHNVLRSRILCAFFAVCGIKIVKINKGRRDKKRLVSEKNKIFKQLPTSFERYANVFSRLGFDIKYQSFESILNTQNAVNDKIKQIGIAPFAKHKGKMYPIEKTEQIVEYFSKTENVKIFLFGGGKNEAEILEKWEHKYNNVVSLAGKFNLCYEIITIAGLDVMLAMDSANMHIASIVNTPVVSVWGATHPFAGFYGWQQKPENAVQIDLQCRPCSVFGDKECFRGDYACLNSITTETIIEKIKLFLNNNS
ncbi:MAG: glycosyltransferase family 9 protein [Prevotellaceae bacterium]|nr:glycosyltransferase family 9 protein [Prevotellaceae bacterium]